MSSEATQSVEKIDTDHLPPNPTHDWILANLVDLANQSGLEQDVTLFIGGTVISGMMIPAKAYLDEVAAGYRATEVDPALREAIDSLAKSFADTKERLNRIQESTPAGAPPRVGYIHLRNAKVHAPGMPEMPGGNGMLWRGRLSRVDAFTLGSLKPA